MKSMASLNRSIDQLLARVRDLEKEVAQLRRRDVQARLYAEAAIVSIESDDTVADALGPIEDDGQEIDSAQATVMEIIDDEGTLLLKPIQNADGEERETLVYWNPYTDQPVDRTTGHSFIVLRLRDGRWVRVGGNGNSAKLFLTSTTISARTGSSTPWTPGNGSAAMLEFYDDAGTLKVRTVSGSHTLRHMGPAAIASGRIVQAKLVEGHWLIDVDYC